MPNMELHTVEDVCLDISDFDATNTSEEILFKIKGKKLKIIIKFTNFNFLFCL